MKEKIRRFLPVGLVVAIAIAGLFFPRHAVVIDIEARGSVERIGQVNFITSEMDPVINFGVLGHRLDLDADNDTSIRASADDTIDFEVSGEDDMQLTDDKLTLGDAGETDFVVLFDGAAKDFYIALDDSEDDLLIGYGSAVATDHVIAINESADVTLGEDQALVLSQIPAANAAGDLLDFTATLGTSDAAADDFIFFDINLTGSATEAARDVIGLELSLTDGADTDYLPVGIKLDAGWDTYLIMGAAADGFTFSEIPIADAGGDSIDFTETLGTSNAAGDDYIFLDVNLTGSATEDARDVVGIDLALTDGADTDYLPFGLKISAGFDTYMMFGPAGDGHIWTEIPVANAGGDSYDFTETLNISDGADDDYIVMDLNVTTSATEAARDVDFLNLNYTDGSDADAIGRGLIMDAGFDQWIVLAGDTGAGVVWQSIPAASAGGDSIDFTDTLNTSDAVGNDYIFLDVNLTGSGTEAARDVIGIELTLTDGVDTDYVPMGIKMDAGWDTFLIMGASGDGTIIKEIPITNVGGDVIDFTETLAASDTVDDDFIFLDVNITGNATEAARDVVGLDLDFVDGAGTASLAYAIELQSGWDNYLHIDSGAFVLAPIPAANATGDTIDFTDTLASTDGTDAYTFMDINITENAAATNTDTAAGIDLDFVPDDGDTISSALVFQAGWDHDLNAVTDLILSVDSNIVLTIMDPPAANASGDSIDFTDTLGAVDGDDDYTFLDVNLTLGAATGSGNEIVVLDIVGITDDAQAITTAIRVGDEWNYALDTTAPVFDTSMHWFDDFIGDTLNATYTDISGADGQALQAIQEEQFGVHQLTSGDVGDTPANDLEAITLSLEWSADQGSLVMEVRMHMDTAVLVSAMCVGFSDDVSTVEMPFIIGGGDAVTSNASDAVCFCYDTDSAADEWFFLGVAGDTDATGNATTGIAPAGGVYQVFRIEIDAGGGDARGYINGVEVGTLTAHAVTGATLLAPWVGVDSHDSASVTVDIDYIAVASDRD